MTTNISQLSPTAVWQWFDKICSIPHPTFHEQQLGDFILQEVQTRGQQYGLTAKKDEKGNIFIDKPASAHLDSNMASHPAVAIQAHFDMVAQKGETTNHDFITDPIKPVIKEGWVWATDTTLGADNGIGLAMALAVAFSDDIVHPPLNLILTCEEEIGMGGVQAISPEWLTAPAMINLDTEDEGELFIGCAGGRDATFQLTCPLITVTDDVTPMLIKVSGLQGGHSGIDIHKGLANANLLLARVLASLFGASPFYLQHWQGGVLRNVITREASAAVLGDFDHITQLLPHILQTLQAEYKVTEPNLTITVEKRVASDQQAPESTNFSAISTDDSQRMLNLLRSLPNGVIRMSDSFDGVVETSISTGVIKLSQTKDNDKTATLEIRCLMRSLGETPKDDIAQRLQALAELAGAELQLSDDYPGWQPDPDSKLLAVAKSVMANHFEGEPKLQVIHAGLECGIFKGKAPTMDMISFGPNIRAAHSPKERVEIASVAKTWQVLLDLLKVL